MAKRIDEGSEKVGGSTHQLFGIGRRERSKEEENPQADIIDIIEEGSNPCLTIGRSLEETIVLASLWTMGFNPWILSLTALVNYYPTAMSPPLMVKTQEG